MAINYLGTSISGLAADTKPTPSGNEKGLLFVETDTNKFYQWDTDSWNEISPTTVLVTDNESTAENNLVPFVANAATATGQQSIEMDGDFHYNPGTGTVSATTFSGTATLASTVTVVDSTDTSSFIAMFDSATGSLAAKTDAGLTYNAGTGILTATGFAGPITGNVTGNTSGAVTATSIALNGNITTAAARVWALMDNDDEALSFDASGKTGMLVFDTRNGAERITMSGDLTVAGTLTVATTTSVSSTTIDVADPLIALATTNTTNSVDIGFYGRYRTNGTNLYTGLVWDAGVSKYILFHGNQAAPTTTVNTGGTGHATSTLIANIEGSSTTAATVTTAAQPAITSLGQQAANLDMGSNTIYGVTQLSGSHADGPRIAGDEASSATNPTFIVDRQEMTTGIGGVSTYVSAIVSGTERIRATTSGAIVTGTLTVGADGSGSDVVLYSGTAGDNLTWDASDEVLIITGTNGATSLNVADGNLVVADTATLATVDINAGAIDGTVIGANSAAAGTFAAIVGTTIDATTDFTIGTTVITDDVITFTPTTSDTVTMTAATNGAFSLVTVDAAAAAANIQITADGTAEMAGTTVTLDSGADVVFDAASFVVSMKGNGTEWLKFYNSSSDTYLYNPISDRDLYLRVNDGGSQVNAIFIDSSDSGHVFLNHDLTLNNGGSLHVQTIDYTDGDLAITINDTGTTTFAQAATFSSSVSVTANAYIYRGDTGYEGGQLNFGRATDNAIGWAIDSFGNAAADSLRFLHGEWSGTVAAQFVSSNDTFYVYHNMNVAGTTPNLIIGDGGDELNSLYFDGSDSNFLIQQGTDGILRLYSQAHTSANSGGSYIANHAFTPTGLGVYQYSISGAFTGSGTSNRTAAVVLASDITGVNGDTGFLSILNAGVHVGSSIATQNNSETVDQVATVYLSEPDLTANDTVTNASTLYIQNAPTEGTNNYALFVDTGASRFDGSIGIGRTAANVGSIGTTMLDVYGDSPIVRISNTAEDDAGIVFDDNNDPTAQNFQILYHSGDEDLTIRSDQADNILKMSAAGVSTFGSLVLFANGSASAPAISNASDTNTGMFFQAADTLGFALGGSEEFRMEADGDFHADGDVYAFSGTVSSDIALKKNIVVIPNALDKVSQLNGVSWDWKDDSRGSSVGLVAQNVEKIFPELVKDAPSLKEGVSSHKNLNYNGIIGLLVESIKELKEEITELKNADRR